MLRAMDTQPDTGARALTPQGQPINTGPLNPCHSDAGWSSFDADSAGAGGHSGQLSTSGDFELDDEES